MPSRNGLSDSNVAITLSEGSEKSGSVKAWGNATVPAGWLELLGQVVLRADYPGLFAHYSTNFNTGGETGLQFRLPDGQGRSIIGVGTYTDTVLGSTSRTLGQKMGAGAHTLTSGEMPSHTHRAKVLIGGISGASAASPVRDDGSFGSDTGMIEATGGGSTHNNMQPSIALKLIVKV